MRAAHNNANEKILTQPRDENCMEGDIYARTHTPLDARIDSCAFSRSFFFVFLKNAKRADANGLAVESIDHGVDSARASLFFPYVLCHTVLTVAYIKIRNFCHRMARVYVRAECYNILCSTAMSDIINVFEFYKCAAEFGNNFSKCFID